MNVVYILYQYNNCQEKDPCNNCQECPIVPIVVAASFNEFTINQLKEEWENKCGNGEDCNGNNLCHTYKICYYFLQ